MIALLIKLNSKGPVLFRQKRQGFNNELIEVYKFRSMYVDHTDAEASRLVTKDDPRVTLIGRFLRKTSLDELPQFFNVVKSDLSLVGPGPHALKAKAEDKLYSDVVDGYFARHRVKPGVTGWAQINGWRGETASMLKSTVRAFAPASMRLHSPSSTLSVCAGKGERRSSMLRHCPAWKARVRLIPTNSDNGDDGRRDDYSSGDCGDNDNGGDGNNMPKQA